MNFCPNEGRAMVRETADGRVAFRCPVCAFTKPGAPADARIAGASLAGGEAVGMYSTLVKSAADDPTNQIVRRKCGCGLPYMTQIRIGSAEQLVYTCKCGRES